MLTLPVLVMTSSMTVPIMYPFTRYTSQ